MDVELYKYFKQILCEIIEINSVSSDYESVQNYIIKIVKELGYEMKLLNKGGVVIDLGGEENPIIITAHADTIGLMVKNINNDGTIEITNIGRLPEYAIENENVTIMNYNGQKYTGTIRRKWSCIHVTPLTLRNEPASYTDNLVLQLDEKVKNSGDVEKLGIFCGDVVSLDPRLSFTPNGYIKSRFLDDKVNVALLISYLKYLKDINKEGMHNILKRKLYIYFSMHEEIMHGGATGIPTDVTEILALDVCCVCMSQQSSEYAVSIGMADSRFPYNRKMIKDLITIANKLNINYKRDIFVPTYGTDADVALLAGHDIRHALIGPGVVGTHGYERTHYEGIINTFRLLVGYLNMEV